MVANLDPGTTKAGETEAKRKRTTNTRPQQEKPANDRPKNADKTKQRRAMTDATCGIQVDMYKQKRNYRQNAPKSSQEKSRNP